MILQASLRSKVFIVWGACFNPNGIPHLPTHISSRTEKRKTSLSLRRRKSLKNNNDTLNHKIPMTRRNILFSFRVLCLLRQMSDGEEGKKGSKRAEWSTSRYSSPQRMFLMFISFHDLNRKSTAFLLFHPRLLFFCWRKKGERRRLARRDGRKIE